MVQLLIKIFLMSTLVTIALQDFRDREVWAFLFPAFGLFGAILQFESTATPVFIESVLINLLVIGILLLAVLVAAKAFMKKKFRQVLGLGDVLFFLGMAVCFPPVAFLNFFVFSVLFTLALTLAFKALGRQAKDTIPLAGSMAIFLIPVYLAHWTGLFERLYLM